MWLLIWHLNSACVRFLCFFEIFILVFFLILVCLSFLFACLLSKEREKEGVESSWWDGGKNLKEDWGGNALIKIYFLKNILIHILFLHKNLCLIIKEKVYQVNSFELGHNWSWRKNWTHFMKWKREWVRRKYRWHHEEGIYWWSR